MLILLRLRCAFCNVEEVYTFTEWAVYFSFETFIEMNSLSHKSKVLKLANKYSVYSIFKVFFVRSTIKFVKLII